MRFLIALLLGLVLSTIGYSSFANDEEIFKQKILSLLNAENSSANHIDLAPQLLIRRPKEPELYRSLVTKELYPRLGNAVVYIVSGDGVMGSGTIVSSSFGLVITNWHVVGNEPVVGLVFKPSRVRGRVFFKKDDIYLARVLKTDSIHDLALLEIVSRPSKIIAVPLGSTAHLEAGQDVFSINHPQESRWSYHEGIISQVEPDHEWISEIGTIHRAATIHTEVVDESGSSGDPIFDANGRFIGLLAGSTIMGSNFAITVDEVRNFVFSSIRGKPSDFFPIIQSPSETIRAILEESYSSEQVTD